MPHAPTPKGIDKDIGDDERILRAIAKRASRPNGPRMLAHLKPAYARLVRLYEENVPDKYRPQLWDRKLEDTAGSMLMHGYGTPGQRDTLAHALDESLYMRGVVRELAAFEIGKTVGQAMTSMHKAGKP